MTRTIPTTQRFCALAAAFFGLLPVQAEDVRNGFSSSADLSSAEPTSADPTSADLGSTLLDDDEPLYAAPTTLDRIGRIAAPVMLNGKGPFRMILDTGANQSVITTRVANVLGLVVSPESRVRLQGVTGSAIVPALHIETLQTGDLVQQNLTVAVLDIGMAGTDGILGTQGFDGLRVTVDFARDRISIVRSRSQRARSYEGTIPATLRFGRLLVVDGFVGRIKVKAVIDTGAEMSLGNLALRDALLFRRRDDDGKDNARVIGMDDVGQPGRYLLTREIRLGDAVISNLPVVFGDIHVFKLWDLQDEPAVLIGMDVLGSLERLVIDYRREEIQFRNTFRLR